MFEVIQSPELNSKQVSSKTDKHFAKIISDKIWNDFMGLKEQNAIIKHILLKCPAKMITMWQKLMGQQYILFYKEGINLLSTEQNKSDKMEDW